MITSKELKEKITNTLMIMLFITIGGLVELKLGELFTVIFVLSFGITSLFFIILDKLVEKEE